MFEEYAVIDDFTEKHIDSLLELYKNEAWTRDRTLEDVKVMLESCRFIALVNKNSNEIIAFARFLSDSVYRAMIYDVIVSVKYRGLGFGRIIIEELINSSLLRNIERVELCCLEHNVGLYEKFSFKRVFEPTCFMRKGNAKDLEIKPE